MKRLTELANKYKTDKGTTHYFCHGFTEFYQEYFEKFDNPTILELGVEKGASECMLNDFYDGDCTIYCVDIEDLSHLFDGHDNIKFFQCDLSKKEEVENLMFKLSGVKFDIIIDDASHIWTDQLLCLSLLNNLLKKDGIYVLEDLHTSLYPYILNSNVWGNSKTYTDSPLYFLNFMAVEPKEYAHLSTQIKDVVIFNRFNKYCNPPRSITSIITFRNE